MAITEAGLTTLVERARQSEADIPAAFAALMDASKGISIVSARQLTSRECFAYLKSVSAFGLSV